MFSSTNFISDSIGSKKESDSSLLREDITKSLILLGEWILLRFQRLSLTYYYLLPVVGWPRALTHNVLPRGPGFDPDHRLFETVNLSIYLINIELGDAVGLPSAHLKNKWQWNLAIKRVQYSGLFLRLGVPLAYRGPLHHIGVAGNDDDFPLIQ